MLSRVGGLDLRCDRMLRRGGGCEEGLGGLDGRGVLFGGGEGLSMGDWGRRRRKFCEGGDVLEEIWDLWLLVYIMIVGRETYALG